ncbi:MAG: transcription antitermination factor NusB [Candidatus Saccharibacteria bacterium]
MASNRHLGRIIALQTLYEQDFRRGSDDISFDLQEVLQRNIARYEATVDDTSFIEQLVNGISAEQDELDALLQPLAPEWPIDQIARMDRVILRMGAYELTHDHGVPPKVVINEAVELAKAFGSTNSSKFINGVLGTLLRRQNGDPDPEPKAPEEAVAPVSAPDEAPDTSASDPDPKENA